MKLDRNEGEGKYAAVNMRKVAALKPVDEEEVRDCLAVLQLHGVLESGVVGGADEFFLIKLKDKFAVSALDAYAQAVVSAAYDCPDDVQPDEGLLEYFRDVQDLAQRAANHPLKKQPD